VAPTCSDGITNGGETDLDCGGTCITKCEVASACAVAADCRSGVCRGGVCEPASSSSVFYVNDGSSVGDRFTTAPGNDSNAGTAAAPFATLARAYAVAGPGSLIYIDSGTYNPVNLLKPLRLLGPNWDISPVTGMRRPEARLTPNTMNGIPGCNPSDPIGCNIQPLCGFVVATASDVTVRGFEITTNKSCQSAGAMMAGSFQSFFGVGDRVVVRMNYFHDLIGSAIAFATSPASAWVVDNNKIENIDLTPFSQYGSFWGDGITLAMNRVDATDLLISNNLIRNTARSGIVTGNLTGLRVIENQVFDTGRSGILVYAGLSSTACGSAYRVLNNTVVRANSSGTLGEGGLTFFAGSTPCWDDTVFSGNDVRLSSPGFTGPAGAFDFSGKTFSFDWNRVTAFGAVAIEHLGRGSMSAANNWFGGLCNPSIFSTADGGSVTYQPCLPR
jgi:hypothetical protein